MVSDDSNRAQARAAVAVPCGRSDDGGGGLGAQTFEHPFAIGRHDAASFALFDDDPSLINQIEPRIAQVTPELIQQTARKYLRPENRTLLHIQPGRAAKPDAPAKEAQ